MLILPQHHRAPFIAPGRRNRKVHWNRALSKAIASLGKFEKEDWRRALWLPESLRAFYPKWNNQFSPGGGTGCGCCGSSTNCFADSQCTQSASELEVLVPACFVDDACSECDLVGGTYILPFVGAGEFRYSESGWCAGEGYNATFAVSVITGCISGSCGYTATVSITDTTNILSAQNNYAKSHLLPLPDPLEIDWVSLTYAPGYTHACSGGSTDPLQVTDFVP